MTPDRMIGLLVIAAHRAWERWNSLSDPKVQGISIALDDNMRYLYRQASEAEIFLSGMVKEK